ncbi:Ribonucleoprotein, chloroplastic [Heracleum sosnowskyi]|uniref:Ribonucleoprotein, chloroplastic n=1 Tax=Heracleum sosnowskyi TaxID=360622 RepID=A0AAD8JCV3_9APIA|nr:Ribonucleoprotein, chloroplastic [Heracleum sosnowskyi]
MSVSTTIASSLHFLPLTPKTPFNSTTSNFNFVSFFTPTLSLSLSSSSTKILKPISYTKLKVAVDEDVTTFSSDLDEDEDEDNRSFSPDLKLFVGNLPFNCDSAVLADLFGSAGTVEMVEVIYDKITGRSRGFAFVTMSTVQEVEAAAQQFNGYELEGRALRVNAGPPPPKEENSFRSPRGGAGGGGGGGGRSYDNTNRLYVGNLSWDVDNAALETLFSEQGKVVDAKVVYDRETGRSRGFGFVTYGSSNEVNRAIDNLNGADLDGRQIRVSVAEAPPQRRY